MWFHLQLSRLLLVGVAACFISWIVFAATTQPTSQPADDRFQIGEVTVKDDFDGDLSHWTVESENGGQVQARDGALEIDVPAGCTVWLKKSIIGPVMIEYEATMVQAGGKNDRVSDLNCFWMARDARSPDDLFATHRSGKFADYNQLKCYYVGLGGNSNTTTRFRRYIGDDTLRPLRPQDDLRDKQFLLIPNVSQTIRLVACGKLIQYYRDDRRIFEMNDAEPYTSGWFGFRTTQNHMTIRHFRVYSLKSN
jgi:Domain of unknown function (DUF6250)